MRHSFEGFLRQKYPGKSLRALDSLDFIRHAEEWSSQLQQENEILREQNIEINNEIISFQQTNNNLSEQELYDLALEKLGRLDGRVTAFIKAILAKRKERR